MACKTCFYCGVELQRKGAAKYCYACKWELESAQAFAISRVHVAIDQGRISPAKGQVCVDCGKPAAHLDHRNYDKPFDVEAVCIACNYRRGPAFFTPGFSWNILATQSPSSPAPMPVSSPSLAPPGD